MITIRNGGDLPRPGPDRLVLYLIGPGFGESQVIAFPDGRWMVVDGCVRGGINMPLSLLRHLGCTKIDLLAITHPDLDHIRGIPDLIRTFPPSVIWQYPVWASLRDHLARWSRGGAEGDRERRLQHVNAAHCAIDVLAKETDCLVHPVIASHGWKPDPSTDYEVRSIAPTNHDQRALGDWIEELLTVEEGRVRVADHVIAWILGDGPLLDAPNGLSLALSVAWRGRRFLLGGDVENGSGSPFSGWRGILRYLALPNINLLHLVTGLELVKVAHHGSPGAFHPEAWAQHAQGREALPVALLTPFSKGASPLPADPVLESLRTHANYLGITADARKAFERAQAAGWKPISSAQPALKEKSGPVLAAVFEGDGSLHLHAASMTALFQSTPPHRRTWHTHLLEEPGL